MPDRIVRDELLTSERYWSVPESAQLLFHHLISVVDDYGNGPAGHFAIRSKCYAGRHIDNAVIEKLVTLLADVDLIRLYRVADVGYLHIPRFRQRLRITKHKFPASPWDKEQTLNEKNVRQMLDTSQTGDGQLSAEVKRSEVKRSKPSSASSDAVSPGFNEFWTNYPLKKAKEDAFKAWKKLSPDEPLLAKILSALLAQKNSEEWTKESGRFVPHPATWLRGRRWEDERVELEPRQRGPVV